MPPVGGDRPRRCRGYHAGSAPRNNGQLYPADPPIVEEIIAVMRRTPDDSPAHGYSANSQDVALSGWSAAGVPTQCTDGLRQLRRMVQVAEVRTALGGSPPWFG